MAAPRRERDAAGKRALFEAPPLKVEDVTAAEGAGRRASLFSAATPPTGEAGKPEGTVPKDVAAYIVCSSCKARTPATAADLARNALKGVAIVPFRRHGLLMVCPACRRRTRCALERPER